MTKKDQNLSAQQQSQLHLELGMRLLERKDYSGAQKHLKTSMEKYPFWREPFFSYAQLQFTLKQYFHARQVLLQCKEIPLPKDNNVLDLAVYKGKEVDWWLARSYFHMGKIDSAIFSFINALVSREGKESD